jgi:hypothetical protein
VITSGRLFLGADGTLTNLAFAFANEPNTGFYLPTTNTIGFATNGVERVRIDNNGLEIMGGSGSVISNDTGDLVIDAADAVKIADSDTNPLLVLGIKSTAGDPTGTNGAMYYNSDSGSFRCYQNGAWSDCIGGNYWNLNQTDGTLYPINETLDILVGGISTAAASIALQAETGNIEASSLNLGTNNLSLSGDTMVSPPIPI